MVIKNQASSIAKQVELTASKVTTLYVFACVLTTPLMADPNPNQPLDRPYTLLNSKPALLEAEYHRLILRDVPQSFTFPRPCWSELDSSNVCEFRKGWSISDTGRDRELRLSPLLGYEYRYLGSHVQAGDFGVVVEGGTGPVSFYLDARIYTEMYDDLFHPSYDREFVERQDENTSGSIAYTSYSRYRSNLSYDWSWGRITAARDALHWGPGQFANLVFQQDAVPFNQLTFTSHLGPVSVQSVYGQLAASDDWEHDSSSETKSVYAHRYEWRASRNIMFGISEQLVMYKATAPFAFLPVIPLFITKASEKERLNNGNIAGDVAYRIPGLGRIYSEFLIDDIQSPTSLFDDSWGNKWAWMTGAHWIQQMGAFQSGLILEYSRVEPWVYTHYLPHTAQAAHQDFPLGNSWGPNSQTAIAKVYLSSQNQWYISIRSDLVWKGTDSGSSLEDIHVSGDERKEFLAGSPSPKWQFNPYGWISWHETMVYASLSIAENIQAVLGVQYAY